MPPPEPVEPVPASDPRLTTLLLAFASVYVIWGSTYLAIRFAIETIPPLTMGAVRFLVAGGAMFIWARASGTPAPTRVQWRAAAVVGILMLTGGNGAVVVAEQWVPSGLVALLVGTVPLWLVLLDGVFGSKARPSPRATLGLLIGFGGVVLLTGSPGVGAGGPQELFGALLVLGGSLTWAIGSLYNRRIQAMPRPRMWIGMQMLTGSAGLGVLAALTGELPEIHPSAVSLKSAAALAYLIVFGALIAYSAYIWLLGVTTPARAGTYAYVNPVVALLLGWALADEPLTFRSLAAAAIILASVILITSEARGWPGSKGARSGRLRSPAT